MFLEHHIIPADLVPNLLVTSHPVRAWTAGKTSHIGCSKLFARAFYATHIQINCLNNVSLDPMQYGFQMEEGDLKAE